MMVDDAHASGVLGRQGRGTVDTSEFTGALTFRSAPVKSDRRSRWIRLWHSRSDRFSLPPRAPFLFSTSHPPSVAATCIAASTFRNRTTVDGQLWPTPLLEKRTRLSLQTRRPHHSASDPNHSIIIGDGRLTRLLRELFKEGVLEPASPFRRSPKRKARIRTIMNRHARRKKNYSRRLECCSAWKEDGDSR